MFILRDKIRQNLRKCYNTTKTNKKKKKKKKNEINYSKFFFFERLQLQTINLNVFYSFEVHFFVKFNIFQALLFSSCFSATTDAEWALLPFSFFHLRRLKFCVVTVYIHKTNETNKNIFYI